MRVLPKICIVVGLLGLGGQLACSVSTDSGASTETHWLIGCSLDSDCEDDGRCLCGICTLSCGGDAGCAAIADGLACAPASSGAFESRCFAEPAPPSGICLASCQDDAQCGEQICVDGFCVAERPPASVSPTPQVVTPQPTPTPTAPISATPEVTGTPEATPQPPTPGLCGETFADIYVTGGLGPFGASWLQMRLSDLGYLWLDGADPGTPRAGFADAALQAALGAALLESPEELEDGYGNCCNAMFDGADTYLTFPGRRNGQVRVSAMQMAPEWLQTLINEASRRGGEIANRESLAPGYARFDLPAPTSDGCEVPSIGPMPKFTLLGPDDQIANLDGISLPGYVAPPFDFRLEGHFGMPDATGFIPIVDSGGGAWSLRIQDPPAGVDAQASFATGLPVQLDLRAISGPGGALRYALVLRDPRDGRVLLAIDQDFAGVAELVDDIQIRETDGDCPQDGDPCGAPRGIQFGGGAPESVRAGEWTAIEVDGYTLAVHVVAAQGTPECDRRRHVWIAVPMLGRELCGDRPSCDCGPECVQNLDCPGAERCVEGSCEPVTCENDFDCSELGLVCSEGRCFCRGTCLSDQDCNVDNFCYDFQFESLSCGTLCGDANYCAGVCEPLRSDQRACALNDGSEGCGCGRRQRNCTEHCTWGGWQDCR